MADNNMPHRNITILDVAREAGVSYSTVSRVLNGYEFVKETTRERVLEVADKMGYVANLQARSLAGGHSQIVGILVPGLDSGYVGEIVTGIDTELGKADYEIMLYTTHRKRGKESKFANLIAGGLSEGLILVAPLIIDTYIEALQAKQFPYVIIDQADETNTSDVIEATNLQGAYEITKHLLELGHKRIGYIQGDRATSAIDRFNGYKSALGDFGIPLDEQIVVQGNFWRSSGYQGTLELLELGTPPTAIFAANDLMAFGALEAITERGLNVPADISVVGFDDISQSSLTMPKLTTVRQPLNKMGRMAARLLLERFENPDVTPRHIAVDTQLIVRESTAPPRQP